MASGSVICGAGLAAHMHAMSYRDAGVDVVGVYDPDSARAETLAGMYGAEVAASADDLLRRDASFVSICGPPPVHTDQAVDALNVDAARIVFVEKPVATTRADIDTLASANGCVPVVQWRAGRALGAARAAIAQGFLGPTPTVSIDMAWRRTADYFAAGRATIEDWGCGVLLSVGVHAVDAVAWALDDAIASATGAVTSRSGLEVDTSAVTHLRFAAGASAALRATFDAGTSSTRIGFCGNGVSAEISGTDSDPVATHVDWHAGDNATIGALRDLEATLGDAVAPPLHPRFLGAAIGAAISGARPGDVEALPTIRDVAGAHLAILDVYDAASSGVNR